MGWPSFTQLSKNYLQVKHLPFAVTGVVVLLSVYVIYLIMMLFFQTASVDLASNEQSDQKSVVVRDWLREIPHWQLFGVAPVQDGRHVPQSRSQLNLHGIFYAADPKNSQAIIIIEGGQGKVYFEGDEVDSGVNIQRISASEVILSRDGVLEKLVLPRRNIEFSADPKPLPLRESR